MFSPDDGRNLKILNSGRVENRKVLMNKENFVPGLRHERYVQIKR